MRCVTGGDCARRDTIERHKKTPQDLCSSPGAFCGSGRLIRCLFPVVEGLKVFVYQLLSAC